MIKLNIACSPGKRMRNRLLKSCESMNLPPTMSHESRPERVSPEIPIPSSPFTFHKHCSGGLQSFKLYLECLRRLRDCECLHQGDSCRLRKVGAGEDAVADQYHEAGERAGPLLSEAGGYRLQDLVCAFRVEDSLQSWKCEFERCIFILLSPFRACCP